ncbi:MAG: amidohydrolase family protein [Psychroserpens sp.]|uniref:amidohydrolase family protein n=1 Tax=Psychroserpens sp. TaxID=2020870 RepID=UPI0030013E73
MKNSLSILALLIFLYGCSDSKKVSESALLIYNANIINVIDGSILSGQSILIDNGIIQSIGTHASMKNLALENNHINIENKYIIPGMWDAHVHIDKLSNDIEHSSRMLSLYTLNGITSIREMGGNWSKIKKLKEKSMQLYYLPTIFTAGPIFENKAFVDWVVKQDNDVEFGQQRIGISTPEEVPFLLDSVLKLGVDFIKVRTAASPDTFFEIAKQCKKNGVKFCGHVDAKVDLYDAVNSGISSLEHVDIFQLTGMTESKMDSIVLLMKTLNTYYCPTLTYFKQHRIYNKDTIKAFLSDSTFTTYRKRAYASKSLLDKSKQAIGWAEESQVPWKKMESNSLKFGKKIVESNISILAGTDGANALVLPGLSLFEELKLYETEFQMDNLSILQTATINPAKYFNIQDIGLVKEGFIADLVILDKNPIENIENIKTTNSVIKSGKLITKDEIHKRFKKIRKYNMQ